MDIITIVVPGTVFLLLCILAYLWLLPTVRAELAEPLRIETERHIIRVGDPGTYTPGTNNVLLPVTIDPKLDWQVYFNGRLLMHQVTGQLREMTVHDATLYPTVVTFSFRVIEGDVVQLLRVI